ncbi:MAG: M81 family metallopeptidase [Acidiferrobacterales bacterium]|nr:M81 family metallopeptidase [Acidiferrobacterales bacterium]
MPQSVYQLPNTPAVAIGGIWHETNTFAAKNTHLEDFKAYQFVTGSDLIERYRDTNSELGGFIRQLTELNFAAVPTTFAAAVPSGTIESKTFFHLLDQLMNQLRNAMPLDGVALALHGAAVAEQIESADAYILEQVRTLVGDNVPVVATFDYHANLNEAMLEYASVLIGYDTYPHVDMAERGVEAINVLKQLLFDERKIECALRKVPLLTSPLKQQTDEFPMSQIIQRLHEIECSPAITCASVAMGFPYSDVAHLGASVVVYGTKVREVDLAANSVATHLWRLRHEFQDNLVSVDECVDTALGNCAHPVIIVEPSDNVGGGSAGDGTGVLHALLEHNAARSVIVIYDPEAVTESIQAGIGSRLKLTIGGKTDSLHGTPVETSAVVQSISDGEYKHKGSYMTGYITSMGQTAVVLSGNVQIVLTSRRSMPFDAEQLRSLNIEPKDQKIIVVKSAIAWKAAYGEIAGKILVADTPGICAADLSRLAFHNRPRHLYPLEQHATYST